MNEQAAREEICRAGASLYARGYVHATAGNISMRLDDSEGGGYLITPTDACLGALEPARLARVGAGLRQTGGDRASKTLALHARIYATAMRFEPATRCVIHTHATHCVALSLGSVPAEATGDASAWLPPLTAYFVMKVGRVPLLGPWRPGAPEAAEAVARSIDVFGVAGTPLRAVMLARLGPVVWHESPAAAMATLEELEETARLRLLAGPAATALPAEEIDDLRRHFGARW